jgi:hypothetical protein
VICDQHYYVPFSGEDVPGLYDMSRRSTPDVMKTHDSASDGLEHKGSIDQELADDCILMAFTGLLEEYDKR